MIKNGNKKPVGNPHWIAGGPAPNPGGNPAWKKGGASGNPKGRPLASERDKLRKAIAAVEKTEKKDLFVHFVERAFKDDNVLVALMRKLLPDCKEISGEVNITSLADFLNGKVIE